MAEFYSPKLTNNGLDLLYKAQGGKELKYTKFVLGDGNYSGSVRTLTSLVNPIMTVDITRLNIQTSGTNKKVTIGFNIDFEDISSSFYLREIGLYAEDPDTHQELLVYYTNAGDTADYITEPEDSTTINEAMYNIEIYIEDVANITAVIDTSMVYASEAELNALASTVAGKVDKVTGKGLSTNDYDDTEKAAVASISSKADQKKSWTTTLDTTWTGNAAPYTKTVTVEGMLATYVPMLDVIYSNTTSTAIQEAEEYSKISKIESGAGTVTLTCFEEKPTISLNVRIEVMF